jgi:F-type H+-transporting ATPase subunit delta
MAAFAGTYARAFADVVFEKRLDAGQVSRELQAIVALLGGTPELRRVWENPSVPATQKRAVLDAIVAREGISRVVRNFIAVLIDHRRIPALEQIIQQFEQALNERLGFAEAEITSAHELDAPTRQQLELQIGKLIGKQVKAHYQQDASILGGAVVKIGSTIYDGSVLGQLQRVKEAISS